MLSMVIVRVFLCTSDLCSTLRNDRRKETRRCVYSSTSIIDKPEDLLLLEYCHMGMGQYMSSVP
uniref:Uncharacterized protein n=1 Tax=Brassica oleracea var. oleracea TaxID=109376 RepID=A0A0D3BGV7_BRAOL